MKSTRLAIILAATGAIGLCGLAAAQRDRTPQAGGGPDMGAALVEGLRKTPGCLGVDAGQFRSGKNAIIAWFEDKAAVARWYHSPTHQRMLGMALGEAAATHEHTPLAHVQDGVPIMVIASITFTDKPEIEEIKLPISQIAIELYSALPGGAHINGRLAPATFVVDHMKDYSTAKQGP